MTSFNLSVLLPSAEGSRIVDRRRSPRALGALGIYGEFFPLRPWLPTPHWMVTFPSSIIYVTGCGSTPLFGGAIRRWQRVA